MYKMAKKKEKLATPEWILEGYDSKADYDKAHGVTQKKKKSKGFNIKICPECGSDEVKLVLSNSDSEEGGGNEWECKKCSWKGPKIEEKELSEEEFMEYLDSKGEEVA